MAAIARRAAAAAPAPNGASDPRYRFLARFGATILSGGIAAIPMAIYHYQAELGLAPQEVWFVGYILAHRWTAALPYPSLRQMSRRTGISTQMLHRYKQSLVEKGYLDVIPRHRSSGGRTSSFYDFSPLFRALEQCLTRDRRDGAWRPTADEEDGVDPWDGAEELGPAHSGVDPEPIAAPGPLALPVSRPEGVRLQRPVVPGSQQKRPFVLAGHTPPAQWPDQPQLPGGTVVALTGAGRLALTAPHPRQATTPDDGGGRLEKRRFDQENVEEPVPRPKSTRGTTHTESPKRLQHNAPNAPHPSAHFHWQQAVERLAGELSPAALHAWILPLNPVAHRSTSDERDPHTVTLGCPSVFHREQVLRRYRAPIEAALGCPVDLVVAPSTD